MQLTATIILGRNKIKTMTIIDCNCNCNITAEHFRFSKFNELSS